IALCTSHNENMNSLCFVGCLFIKDELRDTTIDGVKLVQGASVNVVMLTGDSKNTASSIALETGIMNDYKNVVLSGEELSKLSDEEVKKLIPRLSVVARTLPHDKMRLINLSQELGLVVGMTGDGVNDAPALKKADVGFAMGSGTNVAKEVAGIVILDDNFLSISKTILFG
ncbi:MAG: HAD-IC family P-type ATPase, partial [Erysipelotrichaceae bacterium]